MSQSISLNLHSPHLLISPLGGCGEFGMNTTAYIYRKKLYIVDAGVMFPDPRKLGVAAIMPDISLLANYFKGVEAYIITHGHEDHIGALPFLYKKWPAPIYATPWTCALIQRKFQEHYLDPNCLQMVQSLDTVNCDGIKFTYLHVNHSIPDACALAIETDEVCVVHTGDFKIEDQPLDGKSLDKKIFRELGKKGVNLLIADSTNSQRPGRCPDEWETAQDLSNLIQSSPGRCFITTFASNLWRIKIIAEICRKLKKHLVPIGRGMQNTIELGMQLGYLNIDPSLLLSEEEASQFSDNKLVILVSGSQAEYRSALWRIALSEHRQFKISAQDRIIFSARVIPGNEKNVATLISELEKQGAQVITARTHPNIHVSGHAYQDELIELLTYLRPNFYMPVHGGFSQLIANQKLGKTLSFQNHQIISVQDGDVLEVSPKSVLCFTTIEIPRLFIEQDSTIVISYETLRERLRIGENGVIIITGCFSSSRKNWLISPTLTIQGLKLPIEDDWLVKTNNYLAEAIENLPKQSASDYNEFARIHIRKKVIPIVNKKPVVISQLMIID